MVKKHFTIDRRMYKTMMRSEEGSKRLHRYIREQMLVPPQDEMGFDPHKPYQTVEDEKGLCLRIEQEVDDDAVSV